MMKGAALWFTLLWALPASAADYVSALASHVQGKPVWYISSDDGYHFAYLTVLDGEETWFVDGRKLGSAPSGSIMIRFGEGTQASAQVAISPDGLRLAYERELFSEAGLPLGFTVAVNGKTGPMYEGVGDIMFSPDGEHLAYRARHGGLWHVVMDGVEGPGFQQTPYALAFSRNSAGLAYVANVDGKQQLLLNHKPVQAWPNAGIIYSPDWTRLADTSYNDGKSQMEIGGVKFGRPYADIIGEKFSDDSSRLAYFAQDKAKGPYKVVIDGKETGPELEEVQIDGSWPIFFPPAGKAAYWFGRSGGRWSLYKEGAPKGDWEMILGRPALAFSPTGAHWMYAAVNGTKWLLVIDGEAQPMSPFQFFPRAGLHFDSETEFHFLQWAKDGIYLVCGDLSKVKRSGACIQTMLKLFPPSRSDQGN